MVRIKGRRRLKSSVGTDSAVLIEYSNAARHDADEVLGFVYNGFAFMPKPEAVPFRSLPCDAKAQR